MMPVMYIAIEWREGGGGRGEQEGGRDERGGGREGRGRGEGREGGRGREGGKEGEGIGGKGRRGEERGEGRGGRSVYICVGPGSLNCYSSSMHVLCSLLLSLSQWL